MAVVVGGEKVSASTNYGICHRCKEAVHCDLMVPIVYITEQFGELKGFECQPCSVIDDNDSTPCKDCGKPVIDGCYYCKDCM